MRKKNTRRNNGTSRRERGLVSRLWMATGKRAYNLLTRRVLKRTDGEGRRPKEGPWPEWDPPVGRPD